MAKEINCTNCSRKVSIFDKYCPYCKEKVQKPFYFKPYFLAICTVAILLVISAIILNLSQKSQNSNGVNFDFQQNLSEFFDNSENNDTSEELLENPVTVDSSATPPTTIQNEAIEKALTYYNDFDMSYQEIYTRLTHTRYDGYEEYDALYALDYIDGDYFAKAVIRANYYANEMCMSEVATLNKLTSKYGDLFTQEQAEFAMKNIEADYSANALVMAKKYSQDFFMSERMIYSNLISTELGAFTEEQVTYALENSGIDFKENALIKAREYTDNGGYSKIEAFEQLTAIYGDYFTEDEAQYAIDNLD